MRHPFPDDNLLRGQQDDLQIQQQRAILRQLVAAVDL